MVKHLTVEEAEGAEKLRVDMAKTALIEYVQQFPAQDLKDVLDNVVPPPPPFELPHVSEAFMQLLSEGKFALTATKQVVYTESIPA